jgi:hypothetical protein
MAAWVKVAVERTFAGHDAPAGWLIQCEWPQQPRPGHAFEPARRVDRFAAACQRWAIGEVALNMLSSGDEKGLD